MCQCLTTWCHHAGIVWSKTDVSSEPNTSRLTTGCQVLNTLLCVSRRVCSLINCFNGSISSNKCVLCMLDKASHDIDRNVTYLSCIWRMIMHSQKTVFWILCYWTCTLMFWQTFFISEIKSFDQSISNIISCLILYVLSWTQVQMASCRSVSMSTRL